MHALGSPDPDKRGGAANSDRISAINAAYDTLGTDDKRRTYDLQRPDVRASPSPLCRVQRFFVGRCGFSAFGLHRRVGSLHLHGAAEILHRAPITLLFIHLLRSEKTARASRVVLAVQRALLRRFSSHASFARAQCVAGWKEQPGGGVWRRCKVEEGKESLRRSRTFHPAKKRYRIVLLRARE